MPNTNPVKVIREKCLDCCYGSAKEVELCPCQNCPLWPFRFGKNPYRKKREMSEKQKTVLLAQSFKNRVDNSDHKTESTAQGYTDTTKGADSEKVKR